MSLARFLFRLRIGQGVTRARHCGAAVLPDSYPQWRGRSAWCFVMNAYDVLIEHHVVLRGLCKDITALPPASDERRRQLDELLMELDIHMRIEDDLFYP